MENEAVAQKVMLREDLDQLVTAGGRCVRPVCLIVLNIKGGDSDIGLDLK